ncbi:MAG: putative quinol monooxygenase [Gammaproteobacteria bacterium]|nr:putative quinol monooxygenase [Gammaproteobacteria bacterium]
MTDSEKNTVQAETDRRGFIKTAAVGVLAVGGLGFLRPRAAAAADDSEWITVTATLTLNPDNADDAIAGLKEMVAQVEAEEPGVLAYICNRGVQNPNEILFFEVYENQAATVAHGQTDHMNKFREAAAGFFVGDMKISAYERIGGYHR